jgi:hypothetical protein
LAKDEVERFRTRALLPGLLGAAALAALSALVLGAPASAVRQVALHGKVSVTKEGTGSGTVTSDPPGIDCGDTCLFAFPAEEQKTFQPPTLTARADASSVFAGWGGACSGTGSCTLSTFQELVTYDVTARFDTSRPSSFQLTVSTGGKGRVRSTPAGIDCGTSCSAPFATDSSVRLDAEPLPGWAFGGWSGACTGTGSCAVTLDGAKSVTATFTPPETSYAVAVSVAPGGVVMIDPEGSQCSAACTTSFGAGVAVTLRAVGDGVAWSGDCSGGGPACSLAMDGPKAVAVGFASVVPAGFPLAVGSTGKGHVSADQGGIDCGASCAAVLAAGTKVTLSAAPAAGWRLARWRGACSGVAPGCGLALSEARTAVAAFVEEGTRFPLAVRTTGRGTVSSVPTGLRCGGAACSGTFLAGSAVALRAAAAAGSRLVRWSGACSGIRPACTVGMDGPKSAAVTFARVADRTAPRVTALPSTGTRGQQARLRYRVRDASGRSRARAAVYRGRQPLATVRGAMTATGPGALLTFLPWRVPRSQAPATLRFCVTAQDGSGNRSRPSCAPLRIT